ncbi:hypothetical protein [Microvirga alba]|uniref:Uncharacterized protein n=1 Tax=Microvirga alba TaxID=2791025 RepID=A0A931BTL5_9HYPH|nr:hypothetical protein [Microvirga alba]MBF9233575.1 hypothetical protein [Microvirga alba]
MTTAVFTPALARGMQTSFDASSLFKRIVNALVESRIRRVEIELRRHEALIEDLCRRQDHSSRFLRQDDVLPFKI